MGNPQHVDTPTGVKGVVRRKVVFPKEPGKEDIPPRPYVIFKLKEAFEEDPPRPPIVARDLALLTNMDFGDFYSTVITLNQAAERALFRAMLGEEPPADANERSEKLAAKAIVEKDGTTTCPYLDFPLKGDEIPAIIGPENPKMLSFLAGKDPNGGNDAAFRRRQLQLQITQPEFDALKKKL